MLRYKLTIEYDGTIYAGWQRQQGFPTIQETIEHAIKRFCQEEVTLTVAGRTDAGVHALGQVAHVDLKFKKNDVTTIKDALNAHLSQMMATISILKTEAVRKEFNARFSAIRRHYLYRILNRRSPPTFDKSYSWWIPRTLDAEKMHRAAQCCIGYHDFTTFHATKCQTRTSFRTLDVLDVKRIGEWIEIRASARSFLHKQIRSLAGSLAEVGWGRWSKNDLETALNACNRACCGIVAPAKGLYLTAVEYPDLFS